MKPRAAVGEELRVTNGRTAASSNRHAAASRHRTAKRPRRESPRSRNSQAEAIARLDPQNDKHYPKQHKAEGGVCDVRVRSE